MDIPNNLEIVMKLCIIYHCVTSNDGSGTLKHKSKDIHIILKLYIKKLLILSIRGEVYFNKSSIKRI